MWTRSRTLAIAMLLGSLAPAQTEKAMSTHYPEPKKGNTVDDYHGTKISDPYRGLEDTDSPDTLAWVAAENRVTSAYLEKIPERDAIRAKLTKLYGYERFYGFSKEGTHYFWYHNDGLQNQGVLYTSARLNDSGRVLLDPNILRADGTAALTGVSVSRGGGLLAYALAQAGSDWSEWRVRNVDTGQDLPDLIQWTKFSSLTWAPDGKAFYYQRYPQPDEKSMLTAAKYHGKVYLHRLGDEQGQDQLVYERPDHKEWNFAPILSEDGHYLVLSVEAQDYGRNLLFYQDLKANPVRTTELISELTGRFEYLGNEGSVFYLQTTDGAAKGRIIAVDTSHPERDKWKELVPEQADTLESAQYVDGKFVVSYLKDAHSALKLYTAEGKLIQEIALPGLGTVEVSPAREKDTEIFYSFSTFTSPRVVYQLDLKTLTSTILRQSKLSFDPQRYVTEQVFYHSKDGTKVPMFLVHRRDVKSNPQTPTLLYGYGGFNIALTPGFEPNYIAWMEMGGLLAIANLRGGSEYGEAWHEAGTKLHKQNVFDDFIGAAEWLIAQHRTSRQKLAIFGASNGGLLVGACLNQRPDLFGAALASVGVMDMLRFHKFTVGNNWVGDYGSPENPEEFRAIRAYSPLHNIKVGAHYPATFITTADHDDRVVPGHSFKYAATLQHAQGGKAPILIRIETRAGHGGGKPTSKRIDEFTDQLAFLTKELQMMPARD